MSEETPIESGTDQVAVVTDSTTPPWGSEDEFNPEKAWGLIQNLRGDLTKAKEKSALTAELEARVREFEDAALSDADRAAKELSDAQSASESLATENAILSAIIKHGLSEGDVEFLAGLPATDIPDRAAKLAARLGTGAPSNTAASRPTEALRGGTNPVVDASKSGDWLRDALTKSH